jgi:hypothetical protein
MTDLPSHAQRDECDSRGMRIGRLILQPRATFRAFAEDGEIFTEFGLTGGRGASAPDSGAAHLEVMAVSFEEGAFNAPSSSVHLNTVAHTPKPACEADSIAASKITQERKRKPANDGFVVKHQRSDDDETEGPWKEDLCCTPLTEFPTINHRQTPPPPPHHQGASELLTFSADEVHSGLIFPELS